MLKIGSESDMTMQLSKEKFTIWLKNKMNQDFLLKKIREKLMREGQLVQLILKRKWHEKTKTT